MKLPLRDIAAHARICYPQESCGLVFADARGTLRYVPIDNIAGESDASTRSKVDGYVMDPGQQFRAEREAEAAGERLAVIVHSHPDVGAYFSNEDKAKALAEPGQPWFPGVQYLVVSVRDSRVDGAKLFTWDPAAKDFSETEALEITGID
jgi:adenylyltransferase/sulfurtransferase